MELVYGVVEHPSVPPVGELRKKKSREKRGKEETEESDTETSKLPEYGDIATPGRVSNSVWP